MQSPKSQKGRRQSDLRSEKLVWTLALSFRLLHSATGPNGELEFPTRVTWVLSISSAERTGLATFPPIQKNAAVFSQRVLVCPASKMGSFPDRGARLRTTRHPVRS